MTQETEEPKEYSLKQIDGEINSDGNVTYTLVGIKRLVPDHMNILMGIFHQLEDEGRL